MIVAAAAALGLSQSDIARQAFREFAARQGIALERPRRAVELRLNGKRVGSAS